MSNLRIFGVVVGVISILFVFFVYRGANWKRSNFLILMLMNISIIVVSINPNTINFFRDALSLQESIQGRINTLLILSVIFLLFLTLYLKTNIETSRDQFDHLVRSIVKNQFVWQKDACSGSQMIVVVIPAYNEADNLRLLLPMIPKEIDSIPVRVLVVDDGSQDGTFDVAQQAGAMAVRSPINRGGGAALRSGYDILKSCAANVCVTMDADGQHQPEEIASLVKPILDNNSDLIIGSRVLGKAEKDSLIRLFGVYFFGAVLSFLLGKKITDPSSGFRAVRVDCLNRITIREDQYHTSELIIAAVRKGLCVGEIPISIKKRMHGKSKKGENWRYGMHFVRTIISTWWRK